MGLIAVGMGERGKLQLVGCDISMAYAYAPAMRFVYGRVAVGNVKPRGGAKCGGLNVSTYGVRVVALMQYEHRRGHLESIGFSHGTSTVCKFLGGWGRIIVFLHGADYVPSGLTAHQCGSKGGSTAA